MLPIFAGSHFCLQSVLPLSPRREQHGLNTAKTFDLPLAGASPVETGLRTTLQTDTMRQLVGAVAEFVFVVDRSLRIIMANRGVDERSAKQLEGALVTDLFPQSL